MSVRIFEGSLFHSSSQLAVELPVGASRRAALRYAPLPNRFVCFAESPVWSKVRHRRRISRREDGANNLVVPWKRMAYFHPHLNVEQAVTAVTVHRHVPPGVLYLRRLDRSPN